MKKLFADFVNYKIRFGGVSTVGKFLLRDEAHCLVMDFDRQLYSFDIAKADPHSVAVIRDDTEGVLDKFAELMEKDLRKNSFLRRW